MEEDIDQNDQIQLPPGWGPIVFLAAVILLSNAGLGLWMSSMITTTPPRPAAEAGPPRPVGGQGGAGLAAQGGPGKVGGPEEPGGPGALDGAGAQGGPAAPADASATTYVVDESEFTEELDARLRALAQENGMDPDSLPSAKQLFSQMQRSNLLPRNQELDLETILTGHVMEMTRQAGAAGGSKASDGPGMLGGPGAKGTPGMQPPPGAPPAAQGAPPNE